VTIGICRSCGNSFLRDATWKRLCLPCWIAARRASEAGPALPAPDPGVLRWILQQVHPDKHPGSAIATRASQWLLALRMRFSTPPKE
jgi:hypothetical protein